MASERALKETEARYRQIFNVSPAGIYDVDYRTGTLSNVNKALCDFTGYSREELMNMQALDLLTEESRVLFVNRHRGLSKGEAQPESVYYKARKKSGEEFWMHLDIRYKFEGGEIVGATCVVQDITDLKQMEEEKARLESQLRQSQKMDAIGTLSGGVAHDFNNILAAIMGYAELAAKNTNPAEPAYQHIQQIMKACNRSAELVRQILSFSRKGEIEPKPIRPPRTK